MSVPRRTQETGGGNSPSGRPFDSTALARMEERMENGEKDIEDIRREMRQKDAERQASSDRLEKRIEDDAKARSVLDRDIYERLGSLATMQKVLVTLTALVLASLIGLAFMALKR